jgi:hypothetical protein
LTPGTILAVLANDHVERAVELIPTIGMPIASGLRALHDLRGSAPSGHRGCPHRCGRPQQGRQAASTRDDQSGDRRDVVEAGLIEECLVVPGRKRVPAGILADGRIVNVDDHRRRLVFEPFSCVALVDPGRRGEFGWRQRAASEERCVEAETGTEVHARQIHRGDRRLEKSFNEGVSTRRDHVNGGHVCLPFVRCSQRKTPK